MTLPENTIPHPLADLDRIIHEPARLMILMYLYSVEHADYVFLMRATGLTWGNLSSHILKLEEAGYVEVEKKFVQRKPRSLVHMTQSGRQALDRYRDSMQQVLSGLDK